MAKLTSITLNDGGGPYDTIPTITIAVPDADSAAAEGTVTVSGGKVSSVNITDGGTYYLPGDTGLVTFSLPTEPRKPAKFTATLDDTAITSISIDSGGSFYTANPLVVADIPTGNPRQAVANVILDSNDFSGINLVDSGVFYSIIPIAKLWYSTVGGDSDNIFLNVTVRNSKVGSLALPTSGMLNNILIDSATITIDAPTGQPSDFRAVVTASISDNRVNSYSIVYPGGGYTSPPTFTFESPTGVPNDFLATGTLVISNGVVTAVNITDSGNFYVSGETTFVAGIGTGTAYDFRATATCTINAAGEVNSVTITDSGNFYVTAPTITFGRARSVGTFLVGEEVLQTLSSGVKITGEVASWNDSSYILELTHVGADDGKFHVVVADRNIEGQTSGAIGTVLSVTEQNDLSNNEQNTDFGTEATDFLDFTESNPFGDPS